MHPKFTTIGNSGHQRHPAARAFAGNLRAHVLIHGADKLDIRIDRSRGLLLLPGEEGRQEENKSAKHNCGSIISLMNADEAPVGTVSYELPVYKAGKYLTLRVARQDFALSAEYVRAILPMHEMVALEAAHSYICGFAAVGGRDFPVVDLRAKLGMPHGSRGKDPLIVVVAVEERIAGFIADCVSDVLDLRSRDFRNGAVRGHGRPRRVLDPSQVVSS